VRELKIGTGWVRGVVGDALNPELVIGFSRAFGTWAEGGPVVIGRDTRRSSVMFQQAVVAGLLTSSCRVIDLGETSTPLVSFAIRELGAAGGISITGSHNDSSWNALKFLGPEGALLNPIKSEEFLDLFHASSFQTFDLPPSPPETAAPTIADAYIDHLCSTLAVDDIRRQAFRIALDFRFGAVAPLASRLLERLGAETEALNVAPGKDWHLQLEPTPDSMGALSTLVSNGRFDLGAALNIDGDRLALVAEDGTCLSEEYTLPLVARSRLLRRTGPIVTTFSTSKRIDPVAAEFDQKVIRTAVGESYVMDRGVELEAVIAGEGSGGVAALPASMTFDALQSLGLVLESLSRRGERLSEAVRTIPLTEMRKGRVRCPAPAAYRALEKCRQVYADWITSLDDGIRVDWSDAWLHLRVSNTEPLLRIIAESDDRQRTQEVFEGCLGVIRHSLAGEDIR
jgi:phosphomannomutase